jgi:uncharacterized protein (TIGR00730 family)
MRSVCVFLSSASGHAPAYAEAARALGIEIARRHLRLVYGGSSVGLMRTLADAALEAGAEVIGVIPETLVQREVAHLGLSRLHVVSSMHERKAMMCDLADGFVVAPGGLGTFEEAFEVLTGRLLDFHDKPTVLLDVRGFWTPLLAFLDHAVAEGILRSSARDQVVVMPDAASALDALCCPIPLSG